MDRMAPVPDPSVYDNNRLRDLRHAAEARARCTGRGASDEYMRWSRAMLNISLSAERLIAVSAAILRPPFRAHSASYSSRKIPSFCTLRTAKMYA